MTGFVSSTLPYLRAHWVEAGLVFAMLIPSIAFVTLQPLIYRAIVDQAIVPADAERLAFLVAPLAALLGVRFVGELGRDYVAGRLAAAAVGDLRVAIFNHCQRLSLEFYARTDLGELMGRYATSLDAIENALARDVPALVARGLTLVACVAILFSIEARLAAIGLVLMALLALSPRVLGPKVQRASYRRQEDAARVANAVQENLAAQPVVKAFALHDPALAHLRNQVARLTRSTVQFSLLGGVLAAIMSSGGASLNVLAVGLGAFMVIRGDFSLGTLIAFLDLMWYVTDSLQGLATGIRPLQQAAAATERIQELLNEEPRVVDAPDARPLPRFSGELRLDDVSFSYTGAEMSLDRVSLAIPRGSSVALVGPSGCGKSTVLSLLLRFYDPVRGSVTFDGRDLRQATQASLRSQVGVVFQDSFLFNTTVRENIRLGRVDASDAEVEAAARLAEIDADIKALPAGYETLVGERGGRLSGGQRQRVAIARAMLREPAILILDEATSALDPGTEAAINATLRRVARGRTLISVTHRLSTITDADRIFVFERGRLVEQGRHGDLLERGGTYRTLWEKQAGLVVSEDGSRAAVEAARLRSIPILRELEDGLLEELAARFATEGSIGGRTVVREGEHGDTFYIIARGSVEVLSYGASGEERRLAVLQDGDHFGELALLRNLPRSATVRTLVPTVFLTLRRDHFADLLGKAPQLGEMLEQVHLDRLAATRSCS
ncbi:MAG: ATP-binding cassette domain-containing protein [Chloroflexota bacterium]|nr:ATP-binding cassette domain-containing protein [Chloroflexota bacterium]